LSNFILQQEKKTYVAYGKSLRNWRRCKRWTKLMLDRRSCNRPRILGTMVEWRRGQRWTKLELVRRSCSRNRILGTMVDNLGQIMAWNTAILRNTAIFWRLKGSAIMVLCTLCSTAAFRRCRRSMVTEINLLENEGL
jgi:hypothetical protein